ncbi:hypothetical protein ACFP47_11585 [Nesterenkonia lacusekhoensis]|uniref:Uncharacterized protein n=1 Tax=Nesterenkonia lacusekhoensis TaxID=150832 RepID=A0ABS4T3S7_9MICC|nr:hypothetical protein [Nesterenkonia lacusekhoensis]MBP2319114.1 hypothetical protein [Nesterenkonia lacusekhoensis]
MKQFSLHHNGMELLVEFDEAAVFWHRVRLIVNHEVADQRSLFLGTTRLRATHPRPLAVDARVGLFGPKSVLLRDRAETSVFTKEK